MFGGWVDVNHRLLLIINQQGLFGGVGELWRRGNGAGSNRRIRLIFQDVVCEKEQRRKGNESLKGVIKIDPKIP